MKYLIILLLLIPGVVKADWIDPNIKFVTYPPTPQTMTFTGLSGDTLIIQGDTEINAVYYNGKLKIAHGSCENLGLKHAWSDNSRDYGEIGTLLYIDPNVSVCLNCGLTRRLIITPPSRRYEYK